MLPKKCIPRIVFTVCSKYFIGCSYSVVNNIGKSTNDRHKLINDRVKSQKTIHKSINNNHKLINDRAKSQKTNSKSINDRQKLINDRVKSLKTNNVFR